MSEVNFYLKKAPKKTKENPNPKSLIFLQYKFKGQRLVYSFGESVDPSSWNPKKQLVKSNKTTTADGRYSLNDLLDNLKRVCEEAYNTEIKNGTPTPATLKKYLVDFVNQQKNKTGNNITLYKLIDRFIDNEIQYKGKSKQPETLKKYVTVRNHLKEFERIKRYPIDFDTINLEFYHKYVAFLRSNRTVKIKGEKSVISEPLSNNTIAKDIQVIKVFMNEANDLGYTNNIQHRHKKFFTPWEEVENVYLTEMEVERLFKFDLSHSKRLEETRDLFVFGCHVGLRYSDYSNVQPENIIKNSGDLFIKMITKKTNELVYIPCHPIVLEIFEKYKDRPNQLPKKYTIQKFNENLKDACKKAGFNETGRLAANPDLELWECISSHTARRSFATNLYLQGFPTIEIMKITGHKTEKSFLKYIKVSKLDAAKRLSVHMKEMWNKKLLRVAS